MPTTPMKGANVLVVEDDFELRELYRHALRVAGYRVTGVGDGLDALRYIDAAEPLDVLVLDWGLPRVSGWDVYKELRSRPDTQRLPIIVVTGNSNSIRELRPRD